MGVSNRRKKQAPSKDNGSPIALAKVKTKVTTTATARKKRMIAKPSFGTQQSSARKTRIFPFESPLYNMAALVLFVTLLGGFLLQMHNSWMAQAVKERDPDASSFLLQVCRQEDVFCNDKLVPHRRTQMNVAKNLIRAGERVLQVPRSLQIWDLDALRDSWIRQHLLGAARHESTGNPVDSAAYLAVYLVLLRKESSVIASLHSSDETLESTQKSRLLHYVQRILPSYEDYADFHPILWTDQNMKDLLLPHSATYAVLKAHRDMVQSEYDAFTSTSSSFPELVSLQEYQAMRIAVLSRSFGTGPSAVAAANEISTSKESLEQEVSFYRNRAGIDLSKGCYAMVPILDFYDHHANPNVQYSFDSHKQSFVIYATASGILPGHEVFDTYGKYTDAHLFSKYGFVNGDHSGYTQANLAIWHRVMDLDLRQQFSYLPFRKQPNMRSKRLAPRKNQLIKYLQFDDGYQECIVDAQSQPEAYELKQYKLDYLTRIANKARHWHLITLPLNASVQPAKTSDTPIPFQPPSTDPKSLPSIDKMFRSKDYEAVTSTCRLIVLTHHDYNGQALSLLEENRYNTTKKLTSILTEGSPSLEFRTFICLVRLAKQSLLRYPTSLETERQNLTRASPESFQTPMWTAAHLRVGEMQTLDFLITTSLAAAHELKDKSDSASPAFQIRDEPCPAKAQSMLLDDLL